MYTNEHVQHVREMHGMHFMLTIDQLFQQLQFFDHTSKSLSPMHFSPNTATYIYDVQLISEFDSNGFNGISSTSSSVYTC